MGRVVTVTYRGKPQEIEIEQFIEDRDVNFYAVDWKFVGAVPGPPPTDEEHDAIDNQLWALKNER